MRRIIISALVALTALTSVAAADRPVVRDHRGGVYVAPRGHYVQQPRYQHRQRYTSSPRVVVRPSYRYVRRPIYVQRPVIAYRYNNYYQRPALIVENYPAQTGYYWVAGRWDWNGYEWIWTPGRYEPDPNYQQPYQQQPYQQYPSYDSSYGTTPSYDDGYGHTHSADCGHIY